MLQFFIILSCLISVSVNFSTFLVIGKTSPVTYQVLGHLKTCLVLAFGYILLKNPFSWQNVFGIGVAIVGMGAYSYVSLKESQQQKATEVASAQLAQVTSFVSLIFSRDSIFGIRYKTNDMYIYRNAESLCLYDISLLHEVGFNKTMSMYSTLT